jgi:hypothetical protein
MLLLYGALVSTLLAGGSAADDPKPRTSQPKRMQVCNAEAKEKKLTGDARKQFMSACLKTRAPEAPTSRKASGPDKPANGGRADKRTGG